MNLDECKELALKLATQIGAPMGVSFEEIAGRSQAREVTAARRKLVNALYGHDLRDWQIAKIIGKHVSTVWAYRHLDQKKEASRVYKGKAKAAAHRPKRRGDRSGRNDGQRKPSA